MLGSPSECMCTAGLPPRRACKGCATQAVRRSRARTLGRGQPGARSRSTSCPPLSTPCIQPSARECALSEEQADLVQHDAATVASMSATRDPPCERRPCPAVTGHSTIPAAGYASARPARRTRFATRRRARRTTAHGWAKPSALPARPLQPTPSSCRYLGSWFFFFKFAGQRTRPNDELQSRAAADSRRRGGAGYDRDGPAEPTAAFCTAPGVRGGREVRPRAVRAPARWQERQRRDGILRRARARARVHAGKTLSSGAPAKYFAAGETGGGGG
jgi:hypothetical protein